MPGTAVTEGIKVVSAPVSSREGRDIMREVVPEGARVSASREFWVQVRPGEGPEPVRDGDHMRQGIDEIEYGGVRYRLLEVGDWSSDGFKHVVGVVADGSDWPPP